MTREETILSLGPRVRNTAKAILRNLPRRVLLEDLVSAGWIGAIQSVDRYREERGTQLSTYAALRIRGAILDYLRSIDCYSRPVRDRANKDGIVLPRIDETLMYDPVDRCSSSLIMRFEIRYRIEQAIGLAGDDRDMQIVRMRWNGMTWQSISESMGFTQARAYQIGMRGERRIREAIEGGNAWIEKRQTGRRIAGSSSS